MQKIDTFYVLDFDRCLGDIEASFDLLKEVVEVLADNSGQALQAARHQVESSGGSFNALKHLAELNPDMDLTAVGDLFMRRASQKPGRLLEPGAVELIDFLISTNRDFCIMSYGDARWQILKINAAGLGEVSNVIVSSKMKSNYITQWQDSKSGEFIIPADFFANQQPRLAHEVVLVDDKQLAFQDLASGARGYLVAGKQRTAANNRHSIAMPSSVKVVTRVDEIITQELLLEGRR